MTKWLENNPIGQALAAVCGSLVVASLLLGVIWSLPPTAPGESGAEDANSFRLDVAELQEMEPLEAFAVITERPVFNETRLPVVDDALEDGEGEDELAGADADVDAPELELAGVIITPSLRMATLRQKDLPESLVAFEGQPLEGNYGSWHVSRIGARNVTLASAGGEEIQLQLQIHDVRIAEPPKPAPEKEAQQQAGAETEDGRPVTRAEEIRQRIAERREELRRAAEEREQNEQAEPKAVDYNQAVQRMISGKKTPEKKDGDSR